MAPKNTTVSSSVLENILLTQLAKLGTNNIMTFGGLWRLTNMAFFEHQPKIEVNGVEIANVLNQIRTYAFAHLSTVFFVKYRYLKPILVKNCLIFGNF